MTKIETIWHSNNDYPQIERDETVQIVLEYKHGFIGTSFDGDIYACDEVNNCLRWCYLSDLLSLEQELLKVNDKLKEHKHFCCCSDNEYLTLKLAESEKELNDLKEDIKADQEEYLRAIRENVHLKDDVDSLKEQPEEKEKENLQWITQLCETNSALLKSSEQIQKLNQNFEFVNDIKKNLEQTIEAKDKEIESLSNLVKELKHKNHEMMLDGQALTEILGDPFAVAEEVKNLQSKLQKAFLKYIKRKK